MKVYPLIISLFTFSFSNNESISKNKYPQVIVEKTIATNHQRAFDYILPVDLTKIFKRYKNLPAVVGSSNKKPWVTAGMERTVYFEDNNSAREYLTTVRQHHSFAYRIDGFTSALKLLVRHIEGSWEFTATTNGKTHIQWTYTVVPKNFAAKFIINTFLKKNIKGLLNQAMDILKEDLENQPS